MVADLTQGPVGVIGLGIMGSAFARHLMEAGRIVCGHDVVGEAMDRLERLGGRKAASAAAVGEAADVVLLSLPSVGALDAVTAALAGTMRTGAVVCELGTLPLDAKERARDRLAAKGVTLLDCPVSGTGAQAAQKDLVIYASGEEAAVAAARPVLEAFSRSVLAVGPFGAGMKLKYVANLLVTVHNLAAAEALLLAERSGLDLEMAYEAIRTGAGSSRMFEVRAPLMIEGRYEPATMKQDIYVKDLQLILDHARDVRCPTPLMAASLPYYLAALAGGRDKEDTASLFAVLHDMIRAGDG